MCGNRKRGRPFETLEDKITHFTNYDIHYDWLTNAQHRKSGGMDEAYTCREDPDSEKLYT